MESSRPHSVNVPESRFDDALSKAMQVRDLLGGASALVRAQPSSALAELIATARAAVGDVVDALEESMAIDAERKRVHSQAQKHVGYEGGTR